MRERWLFLARLLRPHSATGGGGRGEYPSHHGAEAKRLAPGPMPYFSPKRPLVLDTQGLTYRMECYSRLLWFRMELVDRLGAESAYVRYLGRLARLYAEIEDF